MSLNIALLGESYLIEKQGHIHIPELKTAKTIHANFHGSESLFDHSINTLKAAKSYTLELRVACLLHDIGKAKAWNPTDNSFHKHELYGEQIVRKLLEEENTPSQMIDYICNLVRHHMFYFDTLPSESTTKRWLRTVGPDWFDLFLLRMADRRGNVNKKYKPAFTTQMQDLEVHFRKIIDKNTVIFENDLALRRSSIIPLMDKENQSKIDELIPTIIGVVNNKPELNCPNKLKSYIMKIYA